MQSKTLSEHFTRLYAQRRPIYAALEPLALDSLWRRPQSGKWSLGETLQHLTKMMRLFRWAVAVALFFERPFARARRSRSYPTHSRDLFTGRALRAPFLIRPSTPVRPLSRVEVVSLLEKETEQLARMLENEEEGVLGHVWMWDPVMGWQNLLQVVDLLAIHESHHFHILRSRWPNLFAP